MGRSDYSDCSDNSSYDKSSYSTRCETESKCDTSRCDDSRYDSCYDDCGLRSSCTPVGVWNLVYSCDNACTTTGNMEWLNQLVLNGDKTLNLFSVPDLVNNPFPCILTPGAGVWEMVRERKYKLEVAHIGYRTSNGAPSAYYKVWITMKFNRKGTKAKFCGRAQAFDLSDPKMCCPTDADPICFTGYACKILEPKLK